MAKVNFIDDCTINVVVRDGESFTLKTYFPVPKEEQQEISCILASSFDQYFSEDKTSMVYDVLMHTTFTAGFSFSWESSDRSEYRQYIGSRIRQLRESKNIEAKALAKLANVDAANLSRIEQGRYSVGLDVLSRIAKVLGVKVDLI